MRTENTWNIANRPCHYFNAWTDIYFWLWLLCKDILIKVWGLMIGRDTSPSNQATRLLSAFLQSGKTRPAIRNFTSALETVDCRLRHWAPVYIGQFSHSGWSDLLPGLGEFNSRKNSSVMTTWLAVQGVYQWWINLNKKFIIDVQNYFQQEKYQYFDDVCWQLRINTDEKWRSISRTWTIIVKSQEWHSLILFAVECWGWILTQPSVYNWFFWRGASNSIC